MAETTSQLFLGVRMQCAHCHNHPYEKWTQNQYYSLAAFFARVRKKDADGAPSVYAGSAGETIHPRSGAVVLPAALDAPPAAAGAVRDRRQALASWMTAPDNPFFARELVNRVWAHLMGRGFVEPVDDLRVTNPPSNEPLFDWLSREFARQHFDVQWLIRSIMRTRAYQRSSTPVPGNERDSRFGSRYLFKRLDAEPLMDAIASLTGVPAKFDGYPVGMRATQLPDTTVSSYFLELFGRPARTTPCECERSDAPNLGQVLHLMNGPDVNERLASREGMIARLSEARIAPTAAVDEIYETAFARPPTPQEQKTAVAALSRPGKRRQATEDLLWAVMNSKEFIFNH
jgi:hypothetical protein